MARSIRRLVPADAAAVASLLDRDPVQNAYLGSELRLYGLRAGTWWGAGSSRRLEGIVLGGSLVVPWIPDLSLAPAVAEAITRQPPPRMLVGPSEQVHAIQRALRAAPPVRERRDPQPLMVLRRGELLVEPSPRVRRGRITDLDVLTVAAAAMHREEMGVDPLVIDPAGWRARMAQLLERRWSWVWMEDGRVVFKTELSAWTPEVVQLQGVYTAPALRGGGIATAGLAAVCADVLTEVPLCSLYVNHFNASALRVYQRLGFTTVGDFATLFF